jgi:hypothetical protein
MCKFYLIKRRLKIFCVVNESLVYNFHHGLFMVKAENW